MATGARHRLDFEEMFAEAQNILSLLMNIQSVVDLIETSHKTMPAEVLCQILEL